MTVKLKLETIKKIRVLLKEDVESKKSWLMSMIENGSDNGLKERIAEYREAYNAFDDFDNWADEQED